MDKAKLGRIGAETPVIGRVLGEITQLLYEQSDLEPVGVYLHGSLALNCFHLGHSDLDLLAVNRLPATPAHRRRWAAALAAISGAPCPVELSIVHVGQVEPWQHPTAYDFHWSEDWRARYAARLAQEEEGAVWAAPVEPDPDLAAHFTVARRRGLSLAGQPITTLPAVPWGDYLDSIRRDLAWAEAGAAENPVYAALNAYRVWAAVTAGLVLSKAEGVAWASERLDGALAQAAQRAGAQYAGVAGAWVGAGVTVEEAQAVVRYVQGQLKEAPATT